MSGGNGPGDGFYPPSGDWDKSTRKSGSTASVSTAPFWETTGSSKSGSPGGRIPPHNLEAERSVLGACLLNNESVYRISEVGLEGRDFYHERHQKIFDAIYALVSRGEPADLVTLTSTLRDKGWYEAVGGSAILTSLFEDTFAIGNVSHYARIVREKALLRRVIDTSSEIAARAYEGIEDTEAFMDEVETKILNVADTGKVDTMSSMQEILVANMHTIEELASRKTDVIGVPTGFTDFDKLTGGMRPGQLIVLAARPAMGKTSMFLSMAQHMAVHSKSVVSIFSLEMTKDELGMRFLSGMSRIDAKRLKVGRIADREWARLAQAADQLSKAKIFIDDAAGITVMDIRSRCRRLLATEKKLDLIVIDYLQLMQGSRNAKASGSREQEISEISRGLKNLAKELKVPIIALSQLNRGLEQRPNKRPMLSDLRESGAIEQDADMVCFIYRDEVYNKDTEEKGIAELIVGKHRAGETATIRLAWLSEYTLFANLASDAPGTPVHPPRPDRGDQVGF
ncbi:replicative DNA helicase [Bdellovibrionota bacterium FG-1]